MLPVTKDRNICFNTVWNFSLRYSVRHLGIPLSWNSGVVYSPVCLVYLSVTRDPSDVPPPPALSPPVTIRFQVGPAAENLAPTAGERGYLRVRVDGLRARLQMSSIQILTDLIEDEKIPPIMPMFIMVTETDVTIKVGDFSS